jgi:hypothetical protein
MDEVKGKGRPKAGQEENSSTSCIIRDPLMDPYYIVKDSSNFTVIKKSVATRGFRGGKATGKEIENNVGYYTSFRNALNCIAKEKFHQNSGEYNSIKEYISSWNEVKDGLESMLNQIEI